MNETAAEMKEDEGTFKEHEDKHLRQLYRLYREHQHFINLETRFKANGYLVFKQGGELTVYKQMAVYE